MLVLSRFAGESIVIGNDIEVMVIDASRGKIRLGITAPANTTIHRKEVWARRKADEGEAGAGGDGAAGAVGRAASTTNVKEAPSANCKQAEPEGDHEQPDPDLGVGG